MRPLDPRDRRRRRSNGSRESQFHLKVQMLAMQTDTRPSLVPSAPVSPEQRSRSHLQGMEQDAHLARFGRCAPTPLTLLPQQTRTAVANARPIDDPQTAIASRRCSCGTRTLPAGHRRVPSGWRGKSAPVKRPAFQDVAVAGGAYPEAGAEAGGEDGGVGASSGCGGMAGANSVVRSGSGARICPNSRRTFQVHCEMHCQASCPQAEWLHQRSGSCSWSSSSRAVSNAPRCR